MGPESGSAEIACQSQLGGVITSGGGFSSIMDRPSWQNATVDNYFHNLSSSQEPTSGYARQGRGYPDLSLIGVEYQVVIGGAMKSVFGTSASSPVLAAFVSLVNAYRLNQNMSSVGFLNPTLYAVGYNNTMHVGNRYNASFQDITSGHNKCCAYSGEDYATQAECCSSGFAVTVGWDPVTGWGSVLFPEFAAMFELNVTYTSSPSSSSSKKTNYELVIIVTVVVVIIVVILMVMAALMIWFHNRPIRIVSA